MAEKEGGVSSHPNLRLRREPFEFGLIPLPSLTQKLADGVVSVISLRSKLQAYAEKAASDPSQRPARISRSTLQQCLGLPETQAHLVLDTLASVLPDDRIASCDLLVQASPSAVDDVGADVDSLVLFLILQLYKRHPNRPHRDASAVADVWPNPFDGYSQPPSSPLQSKSPNSRHRHHWVGADEELHQLQFVQKHLPTLLAAVAVTSVNGEGQVLDQVQFDRLSLFLQPTKRDGLPLSQSSPFFANSDPAMPAVPVPLEKIREWLIHNISGTSPRPIKDDFSAGHNVGMGTGGSGGGDVGMVDAMPQGAPSSGGQASRANGIPVQSLGADWVPEGVTCVEGVTKMSVLKGENNIENGCIRVSHCHDAVVYVLGPLRYASVFGCTDCIVVLGATGKAVKVEHCERLQLIAPCGRIRIANCRECVFYLGTNQSPLVLGDNHKIQVAPYNTFYPRLDAHLADVGIDPAVNMWSMPLVLGKTDPHDANPPTAGWTDLGSEPATLLPPERFVPFVVPFRAPSPQTADTSGQPQATKANPFPLPKAYLMALQQKTKAVETLRQTLKTAVLDESKKKELTNVIQAHFKEWLISSGNIRQVYDLARLDRE